MAKYNLENYLTKDGLGFPLNFRRGNPNPLDNSSVWSSLEAAQNYATNDPVAYVGQILSVVNYSETESSVSVYYIKDEAGTLVPVGTSPIGDESTITIDANGTVSLYGIEGLALTREEEDGSITNISYQPLYINGKLTWVEPSATTVEGLSVEIEAIKNIIGEKATDSSEATGIYADLETLSETVDSKANQSDLETLSETVSSKANQSDLETLSETVDSKANASEVYTIEQIDSKVSDLNTSFTNLESSIDEKIAEGIADAGHLTRVIATDEEIANFILNPETAKENTIYMVKKTDNNNIDSYEEYMLFEVTEGEYSFQMIGDSALSLEDYITLDELNTKLADYATVTTTNSLADLITKNQTDISSLTDVVNQKASASDLAALTETVTANKTSIDTSIAALQQSLDSKASVEDLNSLTTIVNENKSKLESLTSNVQSNSDAITAINTNLTDNYLTINDASNTYVKIKEGYDLVKQSEIDKLALIDLDTTTGDITLNGKVNVDNVEGLDEHLQSYANIIEAIKISGSSTNLSVVDKTVTLPAATAESLGLVKGSSEVGIAADGSLTVGSIDLSKINQGENDILYLDGGASDGSYPSSEY